MFLNRDKRIKGCWNPKCSRCKKNYKYKANDRYCSLCRSELVLVCSRCGGLLEDEGRRHRICNRCLERQERSSENVKKAASSVVGAIGAVAGVVADRIEKK